MTDDHAARENRVRVRALLSGEIDDGTDVLVVGTVTRVAAKTDPHSGQWAQGQLTDATGSVEFIAFPRAYARTGDCCFDEGAQVAVEGRTSVSSERITLVLRSIARTSPGTI